MVESKDLAGLKNEVTISRYPMVEMDEAYKIIKE